MDDTFEKALARLKTDYIEGSGDKLDVIDAIIDRMYRGDGDRGADFVDMQREIHSLKGSAGTYGFASISLITHRLEDYIEATRRLDHDQLRDVQTYIDRIRDIFQAGVNPTEAEMDTLLRALPSGTASLVSAQDVRLVIVLLVMPKRGCSAASSAASWRPAGSRCPSPNRPSRPSAWRFP
jgi:chemotaxis protein histidine kinase CheA